MEETGASIETFINHATQEQEGLAFWDEILNVVQISAFSQFMLDNMMHQVTDLLKLVNIKFKI